MTVVEPVDVRLGQLLSTHPVARGKYLRTGGAALGFAVGGLLLGALLIAHPGLVVGQLLALVVLPTLAGLPIAVVQLNRARHTGRGARYELYENGLVHRTAARTRSWIWAEVAVLDAGPQPAETGPAQVPIVGLVERFGWHFRCVVRFTDGSRVRIDGYTADGPVIAQALLAHRPDAVPAPHTTRGAVMLLWTLPVVITALSVAIVLMYQYMNRTTADVVAPAIGMLACVVVLVMSLVVFVMLLIATIHERRK
ncbi:hypothetical protein [Streptomyces sp. NPDC052012]|uniref:hypothetical protein n=1 Tax=Streptomyces sp. NPDC052012 TaxID=3155051 RepID=UPI00344FAE44